ncbi:6694_t:CDS:2 [Funneliformis geosporum]|uniref:6694_t:CDS:1 n=1 Tax=Funneliformis geosporum TaxID=1117311 RepID=A0A9W4WRE1_9GLOM|nr:6694_t:CDS:2 [Funneliformis geosporum]
MLPSQAVLTQINHKIQETPNRQGEYKKNTHYSLFLLCGEAGLRVNEAINFDLNAKTQKGLYSIKSKGQKKRYVYIPQKVIKELKANNWRPNQTNRFNFYHFLRKIKREVNLSANIELTPHTLRRSFATYHAESGLLLPLLSKLLGHSSVRTTALYWVNIHPDDIFTANKHANLRPQLTTKNQKIAELAGELAQLTTEKEILQSDLASLNEQNAALRQELSVLSQQKAQETSQWEQIQQNLTEVNQTINHLEQKLTATEYNLNQAQQTNNRLCQQLQTERETNANLTAKLNSYEQNHINLLNAYQIALKDKELAQKQLNQLLETIKTAAKQFHQWSKVNYYQQLEKQNELKAQILQPNPPPWKPR